MTQHSSKSYGIGVDIGTTTVGMALVDKTTGAILAETGFLNPQKQHGADVVSRIRYGSTKEGAKELGLAIKRALFDGIQQLIQNNDEKVEITEIVISANTAMEYLLLERITKELGEHPFTMQNVGFRELLFVDVFEEFITEEMTSFDLLKHCKLILIPCISTFVGGDITSGLYYLGFTKQEEVNLLLDLGTNGEMVISGENGFFATSVPAGPAFEASIRGRGRRGTTLIEWIARARCRGQLLASGALAKRYEKTGIPLEDDVVLTQDVLRKIQLAKGAVMASIALLIQQYGISAKDVQSIYLAGSFGFHLDIQSAILIGMLPKEFQGKIKVVGNTSLKGAIACLSDQNRKERLEAMTNQVQSFNLANTKEFGQLFMEHMNFCTMSIDTKEK